MADRRELLLAAAAAALGEGYIVPLSGSSTLDEYSVANHENERQLGAAHAQDGVSQSFQLSVPARLNVVRFYLKKFGSPTGPVTVSLYAATGTHGSTARPTGTALATGSLDAASLSSSLTLTSCNIPPTLLAADTTYCVAVEYVGGNGSNYVMVGGDQSSPTHDGNEAVHLTGGAWVEDDSRDEIFSIIGALQLDRPEGLRVARHLSRQADVEGLPELVPFYLGETLSTYAGGSTGESRREVSIGVRARAVADADESGDAALIPVLQWAEMALLGSDFGALGGIASKGELVSIDPVDTAEFADVFAEALMRFSFTVHTKWGDPRQAP